MHRIIMLFVAFCFISTASTYAASDKFDESVTQIKEILGRFNSPEEVSIADLFEMTILAESLSDAAQGECLEEIKPALKELFLDIYIARQSIRSQEELNDEYFNELEGRIDSISIADLLDLKMRGKYISQAYLHLGIASHEISKAAMNSLPCEP